MKVGEHGKCDYDCTFYKMVMIKINYSKSTRCSNPEYTPAGTYTGIICASPE